MAPEHNRTSRANESGFIFSGIAIVVVLILAITLNWMAGNASITSKVAGNYSISSQSHWSAMSGLEVGKSKLEMGNSTFSGDYLFAGNTVSVNLRTVDKNGNALPAALKRIESIASVSDALRKMEILFLSTGGGGGGWPDTSIIEDVPYVKICPRGIDSNDHPCINVTFAPNNLSVSVQALCGKLENVVLQYIDCVEDQQTNKKGTAGTFEGKGKNSGKMIVGVWVKSGNNLSGDGPDYGEYFSNPAFAGISLFNIRGNSTMNGQIYIGGNVSIDNNASLGDPPGNPVKIFVPPGKSVSGNINENTSWMVHPEGAQTLPDLHEEIYDSLLAIAYAIQNTEENFKQGEMILTKTFLDMTVFPTKTFFINGDFSLRGSYIITDATPESPAMITATGNIFIEKAGRDQSSVPDNLIIIAAGSVTVSDNSVFGTGVAASDGTPFHNQLYGKLGVMIKGNPTVYSQLLSPTNVFLEGTSHTYGRIYAGNSFQIFGDAYFEGILMAKKVDSPPNAFESGTLNFKPYFPSNSVTGRNSYNIVPNSIREF